MELQEIFTALEGKQMRIKQLEQMLEQMEEQQNRAQAQRTRLESRIAQLEMSAKEKTHRYVEDYNLSLKDFPNSPLKIPSPSFHPQSPTLFQELQNSSIKISNQSKINKIDQSKYQNKASPRDHSIKRQIVTEIKNNSIERYNEGEKINCQLSANTAEVLAYKMHGNQYDWLSKPLKSPRFSLDLKNSPAREFLSFKDKTSRKKNVRNGRKRSPSRESIIRGYKKRSFRFNRPYCDYQSPRKSTPSIRVRQYSV